MYASIDKAVSRMERQLKKFKAKIKSKNQREIKTMKTSGLEAEEVQSYVAEKEPQLIRVDRFASKPMSVNEALIQLDMGHDDFIVFTNSEDNEVNVIYRRFDGKIGRAHV